MSGVLEETATAFDIEFTVVDASAIQFKARVEMNPGNWFSLNVKSDADEEFYGMGLQYTVWNFKNESVQLIVSEGGVGRGLQPITREMNSGGGGGGNTMTSYGPTASWISNRNRAYSFDNVNIGIVNFDTTNTEVLYWHASEMNGNIFIGYDFMELTENLTQHLGTMAPLPEWVTKGCIIGIEGGQEFVEEHYQRMKELELPMVGIWMQDWVGEYAFPEGTRLLWNWQLNRDWYYDWDGMVD